MFHLMTKTGPYCGFMGCTAGQGVAKASGVDQCSFQQREAADLAVKALKAHGLICTIAGGDCPEAGVQASAPPSPAPTVADQFRALLASGLDTGAARVIMAEGSQEPFADIIAQARERWAEDELEIDDAPEVSEGAGGAWVAAWVWVETSEEDEGDA